MGRWKSGFLVGLAMAVALGFTVAASEQVSRQEFDVLRAQVAMLSSQMGRMQTTLQELQARERRRAADVPGKKAKQVASTGAMTFAQMVPFGPKAAAEVIGKVVSGGCMVDKVAPEPNGQSRMTLVAFTGNIGLAASENVVCELVVPADIGVSYGEGDSVRVQGKVANAELRGNGSTVELRLVLSGATLFFLHPSAGPTAGEGTFSAFGLH